MRPQTKPAGVFFLVILWPIFENFPHQPTYLHDLWVKRMRYRQISMSQAYTKPTQSLHDTYTKTALLRREAYTTEAD